MEFEYTEYKPKNQEQRILCAECGTLITPNDANLCVDCIRNDVDITDGIPKQSTVQFCRNCERYQQPPSNWIIAELESKELLTLCLKKLKGLSKVRLVDAGFVWTEPHSRRLKVKLTIQKEVYSSAILQQIFIVEYIVCAQQCPDCTRLAAQQTWKASIQVRQKVQHKRTFFWLEQLILKHNVHKDTVNIKECRDGIDFFYVGRNHAVKMLDFLASVVPIKIKASEQLISTDIHTSTSNFKFTYSVEIVPVCKDDLICLPTKLAKALGDISPLVICTRVGNNLTVIDPNTLKSAELRTSVYFEQPFMSLCEQRDLVEFYIIDVIPEQTIGKLTLATLEVSLSNDLSKTWFTKTHLGKLFNPGDHAKGYLLQNSNFNNSDFDVYLDRVRTSSRQGHLGGGVPDVIIVRKSYPDRRKKNKGRKWRLKNLAKEVEEDEINGRGKKVDYLRQEADYEEFLRDLEEDVELRGMVNLFKDQRKKDIEMESVVDEDEEEDFPEIGVDELLDDLDALNIQDEVMVEQPEDD